MEKENMANVVFLISLAITLLTQFPGIAPYRDSGEMVTAINSLGILHPPGYPLYTLFGKIFILLVPFGNIAYRLNLFSGVFTGLSAIFIVKIFQILNKQLHKNSNNKTNIISIISSIFLSLLFTTSYLQWYLSLVSEMYTFNIFFVSLLTYLIIRTLHLTELNISLLYFIVFIFGLSLTNRMDILMLGPGIFIFLLIYIKSYSIKIDYSFILRILMFFLLGMSVYFYLPLRSAQDPFFDWNHPATFEKLYSTLTRKTHGGTLDLLSVSYANGENFLSGITFYIKHLFNGFGYLGLLLGIYGLCLSFKKIFIYFLFLGFILSGPVFIYLANMPPNPHALAIVEAHFLLPNFIFFMFILMGFNALTHKFNNNILLFIPVLLTGINFYNNVNELNKRNNFFAYDYARNVLRTTSKNSILIAKKDVQLFSLWTLQNISNYRNDTVVVAEGLSASPWYHNMLKRKYSNLYLCSVKDTESLRQFLSGNISNRDICFTVDTELPFVQEYPNFPYGLVSKYVKTFSPQQTDALLSHIYIYRGKYDYDAYREFFTPDLIDDYAKARHKLGYYYMSSSKYSDARKNFAIVLLLKKDFLIATYHFAYTYFAENDLNNAEKFYLNSVLEHEYTLKLAKKYNALQDVVESIKRDFAEIYLHLGVIKEKTENINMALQYYSKALEQNPRFSRAYFNKAVIYWKMNDWNNVIDELTKAISIDPNFNEAKFYLEQAKKKLK